MDSKKVGIWGVPFNVVVQKLDDTNENSSNRVMGKKKASLRDKQIKLRASIDKRKKSMH